MPKGVALTLLSIWRLAIAVTAAVGFVLYVNGNMKNLAFFTQQSNLLVAVYYAWALVQPAFSGGRLHEPRSGGVRGAVVVYIIVTGVIFNTMMSGDLSRPQDLLSHLIVPLMVTFDWIFVGRNQKAVRWWHPLAWLAYPVAYIIFYIAWGSSQGRYLYGFLNPNKSAFFGTVAAFFFGFAVLGFVVMLVGKIKGALLSAGQQPPGQPGQPGQYPPPGPYPGHGPYQQQGQPQGSGPYPAGPYQPQPQFAPTMAPQPGPPPGPPQWQPQPQPHQPPGQQPFAGPPAPQPSGPFAQPAPPMRQYPQNPQ